MRILHVVPTYWPAMRYGGPIQSVHGLCRALAAMGHDVHVYTTNVDGPGTSDVPTGVPVSVDGVTVWYFPTGRGRRLYRAPDMAAKLAVSLTDFDVVHLHSVFLWPTAVAARLARRDGVPYVVSPRGMLVRDLIDRKSRWVKRAWIRLFESSNLARAASVHVTSEIEAREIAALGLQVVRFDVIPNGIDLPPGPTSPRTPGPPMILSLGRVSWKKGLDRLIRAVATLPDAELVIAGNDEEGLSNTLERLARELGVGSRVQFSGAVQGDAKWDCFRQADVFALASHSENFGIAVLEAMACGLPVVVTPEVGLAPAVENAGAGIVAPGDSDRFAAALRRLIDEPSLRARMGAAGRELAERRFSWEAIAQSTERLYQELSGIKA